MNALSYLSTATCLLLLTPVCLPADNHCSTVKEKGRFFTLSVNRRYDQGSGDWIRTFSVENTDSEKPSDDIVLEATHSNVECQGKNLVRLEVVVRELRSNLSTLEKWNHFLTFHKRHGTNVFVVDDGRTAQKINPDDPHNAVLFTNRPLRDNEIFEIRLEKKVKKTNHALGFGVSIYSPDEVEILPEIHIWNQTWIMKHSNIYQSGKEFKSNYGKNLDTLEVNDRLGVTRRDNGELHFFVNGVDQGVASVVPESVYGVLELWHDANRARIIY
ncbi:neuralized-like protein 4 [Hetaerina americana]|uniref:neuralized-like protein 4 n=1 Tax=Hetaerina americana TaxID=62018 RepID=UPI003A7F3B0E